MSKRVVVLIFAHREHLEWYEKIALEQCFRILVNHPIILICPVGLDLTAYRKIVPHFEVDFIPCHWLASVRAYNRLKILRFLYDRYRRFEFMLTYELDAFVFNDELLEWCAEGWDYIGAPWFPDFSFGKPGMPPVRVGNSGFSLRRIEPLRRVSRTWRYQVPARRVLSGMVRRERSVRSALAALTYTNNFFDCFNDSQENEDAFWCKIAANRFPRFRVARYEAARRFSFEFNPGRLFRELGNRLPFGCHKWMTYEPEFWSPHIRRLGYEFPSESSRAPESGFATQTFNVVNSRDNGYLNTTKDSS